MAQSRRTPSSKASIKPQYLVILDVSGLLCCKISHSVAKKRLGDCFKSARKSPGPPQANRGQSPPLGGRDIPSSTLQLRSYSLLARPGVVAFLEKLLEQYAVAIFSSTTEINLGQILAWLLPSGLQQRLTFVWDRSRTRLDPEYGRKPHISAYQTIKQLVDVWDCPTFNAQRQWGSCNTLLVDHELAKLRFNNPSNFLLTSEWRMELSLPADDNQDSLEDLRLEIDRALTNLPQDTSKPAR